MLRRVYISTYGCQMNTRDSEEVTGLLMDRGYALAAREEEADVLLYNTCSVRGHAEDKVWSELGRVRAMKAARPELVIGVMGCMAQAQREAIFRRAPHVDFISGPAQLYDVPELIESILESRRATNKEREVGGGCETVSTLALPLAAIREKRRREFQAIAYHAGKVTALVTVMEGCDKVCSYCIVPYTRGPEVSRPPEQVVAEVQELARAGYREVTLLGQNVNSYGRRFPGENGPARPSTGPVLSLSKGSGQTGQERPDFPELLRRVNAVEGIERIRFITSHPWDAVEGLFAAMRDLEHVCEHLHLPVQSGSDAVLERMRRGYTAAEYLERIALLRKMVPGAAVTTDLMVGFPGETGEDFEATVRLAERARFDSAFIFKYSPRPFAASSRWADDVPEEEKGRRLQALLRLQEGISREEAQRSVGQEVEVLAEEPGMGRTRANRKVYFPEDGAKPGDLVRLRVKGIRGQSLLGEVVSGRHPRASEDPMRRRRLLWIPAFAGMTALASAAVAEEIASLQGAFLRGEYETVVRESGRGQPQDELLYLRGVSALKLRDWELARAALTRLVEEHPASPWAPHGWLALGDCWAASGRPEKALEVYEGVLREGRVGHLTPQALFRLGRIQRELGLWEEARASLEQVARAAPDSAEAGQAKEILGGDDFFFTVQVGSFITRSNAVRLTQELQRRGYPAEVSEAVMQGKRFHRVRVGRFARRAEAQAQSRRLSEDGFPARIFP